MRLKTRNFGGIKPPSFRINLLLSVFIAACVIFIGRLVNLQFASKEAYTSGISSADSVTEEIVTVRGEIADVNGVTLASNIIKNSITLDKKKLPAGSENDVILQLTNFFDKNGIAYTDVLPISSAFPYSLDNDFFQNSEKQKYVRNYAKYRGLSEEKLTENGSSLFENLSYYYGISENDGYGDEEKRKIMGLRFTLDVNAYSTNKPCVIVPEVSQEVVNKLSDSLHNFPGLEISVETQRHYNIDRLASHILGRIGNIFAEDKDYYAERGYSLDEKVGKDGAEYAFEEYLRGINGEKRITYSRNGNEIIGEEITKEAKPGYTVRLTIDSEMQAVAESALERVITAQAENGRNSQKKNNGEDANSGAVVVMDPRDGAVRVLASYPTYSLNTYGDDIAELSADEKNTPLLNRATSGIYEPGSTFKIATAAAALHYGVTDFSELIYDKGEYDFHPTYKPHCWIYDSKGITHGYQNVVTAIQNSCNYYFFEMGKRLGIEKINSYAKSLGLGVKTGIEIGESAGIMISPQYMEANGLGWNPGYVLQAAIGQQHLFTPIQICSYICTFLNGGTRHKAHLFDSARDYATDEVIEAYTPETLSEATIPTETVETLKQAMRKVVDDGTASSTFVGYKYPVGGKTGTAQVSNGSDNAIFVGFAPYENPEIVVTVILEHGNLSKNAAQIAKEIFDCYFSKIYPEDFAAAGTAAPSADSDLSDDNSWANSLESSENVSDSDSELGEANGNSEPLMGDIIGG